MLSLPQPHYYCGHHLTSPLGRPGRVHGCHAPIFRTPAVPLPPSRRQSRFRRGRTTAAHVLAGAEEETSPFFLPKSHIIRDSRVSGLICSLAKVIALAHEVSPVGERQEATQPVSHDRVATRHFPRRHGHARRPTRCSMALARP